jgi:hypothetical protein
MFGRSFRLGYCRRCLFVLQILERGKNSIRTGVNSNWRDKAPVNFPFRIDHKQRALTYTVLVPVNTIAAGNFPLWLKVGEKWEMQFAVACKCCVTPGSVDRNSD